MDLERAAVGALDRLADAARQVNVCGRDDHPGIGALSILAMRLRAGGQNGRARSKCRRVIRPQCRGTRGKCPLSRGQIHWSMPSSRDDRRRRIAGSPPALRLLPRLIGIKHHPAERARRYDGRVGESRFSAVSFITDSLRANRAG